MLVLVRITTKKKREKKMISPKSTSTSIKSAMTLILASSRNEQPVSRRENEDKHNGHGL